MQKGIYYSFLPGEKPEDKFSWVRTLGFECVEIPTLRTPEERAYFKRAAENTGVRIPSIMNSDHWGAPFSAPDPETRAKGMACLQQSLDTALAVGADTVLIVPAVVTPQVRFEDAWTRSQAELKTIVPEFEKNKIYMAIEDVGNKILLSPPEMARYIDDFNSPYVAAYFDVGNVIPYGYPEHWILTLGSRIKKMHVKGYSAKTRTSTPDLLSGTIDWPAVMKAVREVGYDDVFTAELRGVGNTAYDCCKSISEDMDKILEM